MSMSIRVDGTRTAGIEYAGALGAARPLPLGAQPPDLAYLRMLTEVKRFHRDARESWPPAVDRRATRRRCGRSPRRVGFSAYFTRTSSSRWWRRCGPATRPRPRLPGALPLRVPRPPRHAHGLRVAHVAHRDGRLRAATSRRSRPVSTRSGWRRPVTSVVETADGVGVTDAHGDTDAYDAVVIAAHPHQALAMLAEPTAASATCSAPSPTRPTSPSCTPTSRCCRASRAPGPRGTTGVGAEDDARPGPGHLRHDPAAAARRARPPLPRHPQRRGPRRPGHGHRHDDYEHPLYTPESVAAQRRLPEINTARIAFAGAYHGWGFHEDGALSGVAPPPRSACDVGPIGRPGRGLAVAS